LVPCGTPDGTPCHSEKHSPDSFTLCFLSNRKLITHFLLIMGDEVETFFVQGFDVG
jgi:hypothetical protein